MADHPEAPSPAVVLFVDDEPSILSALRRLFRPQGYTILTAESGAAGLAALEQQPVDLVVSDMRMPLMDGAQFLEQVRSRWPEVMRILLTGYADVTSTIAAINRGEIFRYIAKPWNDEEIILTVREALEHRRLKAENTRLLALTRAQNEELLRLNTGLEAQVVARTAELSQTLAMLEASHGELKKGFMNSVRVFAGLIELRSGPALGGHSRRVADHARTLAQRLGMRESEIQDVLLAGLLHDIGKIGLPDHLLGRPFNTLPGDLRGQVMKHVLVGQNVLMGVEQLKNAALLVRHHHECFDGTGYPDRLTGMAIPLGSRILAVANDYDAVQLGTLTQNALRPDEAASYIVENRGRRYDPAVADAFIKLLAESHKATELPMRPRQLVPGMVVARDLTHRDGYLLLAREQALNEPLIRQLQQMEAADGQPLVLYIRKETP